MADTVETAIYRLQIEGEEKIAELTRSINEFGNAEERATSITRTGSQAIQNRIARADDLTRAQQTYLKDLQAIARAQEAGTATLTQLNALMEASTARYQNTVAGLNKATEATEKYTRAQIDQMKALQAGANFQQDLNKLLNVRADPRGAEAAQSAAAFTEGGMGPIPTAIKHMDQLGNSTKAARYEMINLGRQVNDVVVSLASGQNILMVGIQQGSQILDVFTSSERTAGEMFKQIGTSIGSFLINPLTLAIGGTTALVGVTLALANAYDKVQVSSQRAISGAGARTGTTISDLNQFVSQQSAPLGSGTGLSEKETRKLAEGLTQTGDIVISKLHDMSNAVMGFANQTGKSVDEAIKDFIRFGTDPIKGLDELQKAFGPVEQSVRDAAEAAVIAGDKTKAYGIVLDAMSGKTKAAAENMGVLEKAARAVTNALAIEAGKPVGIEQAIESTTKKLNDAINFAGTAPNKGVAAAQIGELTNKLIELQKAAENVNIARAADQMNDLAEKARVATESIIPQIDQLKKLEEQYNQLKAAKQAGVGGPNIDAAITAIENLTAKTRETMEQTARYNDRVKEISKSWGDVGQSTALALQQMQNQLPVAQAVGGAAKIQAQYQADINDGLDKGLKKEEAIALASKKRELSLAAVNAAAKEATWQMQNQLPVAEAVGGAARIQAQEQATINKLLHEGVTLENAMANAAAERALAQAQINSQAKETLWNLRNQAEAAAAVTGEQQMAAQAAAAYNKMVFDGVDATIASAVAAQQLANVQAAATANVFRQVEALKDSTAMIKAQASGTEAVTAASIAYKNAIKSGADSTAAAALSAATLKNHLAQAGQFATTIAEMMLNANTQLQSFQQGIGMSLLAAQTAATAGGQDPNQYATRATGLAFTTRSTAPGGAWGEGGTLSFDPSQNVSVTYFGQGDITHQLSKPYDPYKGYADAKAAEIARQADLHAKAVADKQDALKNSVDKLTTSTDNLNATNQELLSPYYTMDPRTSHIGFRSQGMASGGYVDVPGGYSANDNLLATIPVASGERIYVDPMTGRRGTGGSAVTINISSPITINGNADKDQFGRTLYQSNQQLAKQVRAATQ